MRRDAHARRGAVALLGAFATAAALAGCGGGSDATGGSSGDALEFAQWWEPELPDDRNVEREGVLHFVFNQCGCFFAL